MIASVFLAFFNNLTFLFGTCYPGNTTDDMFVSSIFDSIKVVKTHSLTLGMQNLFVLIVFIFVMHDYLSREILNQSMQLTRQPLRYRKHSVQSEYLKPP